MLPATCIQMHEYYKNAIRFILHNVRPLPTGNELKELETEAGYEVNDWSRELYDPDGEWSNLQILFRDGPLKPSYAGKNAKRAEKADFLMDNLFDQSFEDVLNDIKNPDAIFIDDAKTLKNAARDFCVPKYAKMIQVKIRERRVKDFKVQFEPAVRVCMTLPVYAEMQAALMEAAAAKFEEFVGEPAKAIE